MWPKSRSARPKQFIDLVGETSLFQQSLERVKDAGRYEAPIVITNAEYRFLVAEQAQERGIALGAILLEPVARNTALQRLFGDKEAIVGIGDDDWRPIAPGILHPFQALLEETAVPNQINELFRPRRTRLRPQTGPLTPGENDRNNG